MDAVTISNLLLWLAVLALALMLWALSRQVGVLFERVAPMGALVTDAGPAVGTASPQLTLTGLQSETVQIGFAQPQAMLVFFLAPSCPVCKKLLPVLKALLQDEGRWLTLVLASDGPGDHLGFVRAQGLQIMPYVLSAELGMAYRVSRLPYAVLIDPQGRIAAKGLVNSREQLDSLLNAYEMRTPTIQHYLGDPARAG